MKALEWLRDNAATITFVLGVTTGVFNWLTKPRTPEELLAMPPRVAAFFRFMNAVFPDTPKTFESIWQFWKNTHDRLPPKNPKGD